MAHRKFGLRSVRVPFDVVYELHEEYNERDTASPFRYSVRRATTAEARVRGDSYAAYLCDSRGRRLPGTEDYFFTIYPRRRKPAATPTAPASAEAHPVTGEPVAPPPEASASLGDSEEAPGSGPTGPTAHV